MYIIWAEYWRNLKMFQLPVITVVGGIICCDFTPWIVKRLHVQSWEKPHWSYCMESFRWRDVNVLTLWTLPSTHISWLPLSYLLTSFTQESAVKFGMFGTIYMGIFGSWSVCLLKVLKKVVILKNKKPRNKWCHRQMLEEQEKGCIEPLLDSCKLPTWNQLEPQGNGFAWACFETNDAVSHSQAHDAPKQVKSYIPLTSVKQHAGQQRKSAKVGWKLWASQLLFFLIQFLTQAPLAKHSWEQNNFDVLDTWSHHHGTRIRKWQSLLTYFRIITDCLDWVLDVTSGILTETRWEWCGELECSCLSVGFPL